MKSQLEEKMKFTRGGKVYVLTAKPFWATHAFEMYDGSIGIARVDAYYADQRYKKRVDGLLPDYTSGTLEEGYDGEFVHCMIDLTQSELDAIRMSPEYLELPEPHFCSSVETPRPKTNNPDIKVSSRDEQARVHAALQNEGYDEPELVDNTPYQKGDDLP